MRWLANLAGFKSVWFLSLLGAGTERPWLGSLALGRFALVHFLTSTSRRADLAIALAAGLAGLASDTLYIHLGLLDYAAPYPLVGLAPFWIVVMWMNFGLTLNGSLRWLHGRYAVAAGLGAAGGPLAYWAGVELGAATLLVPPALAAPIVALTWAIAVPTLLWAAGRINARVSELGSPGLAMRAASLG